MRQLIERIIGERFEVDGVKLICVEEAAPFQFPCKRCYFGTKDCSLIPSPCLALFRQDGKM